MKQRKLAIIGASYLQAPLIEKAKEMGLETHVFAWAEGDVGERLADHFHPISIVEKDAILARCRETGIDGICTIASDLAAVTVGYVAEAMGLPGNSPSCVRRSTNKRAMRRAFAENGDPSPRSVPVESAADLAGAGLRYPLIIKPVDRSGSRGIMKLEGPDGAGGPVCPENPAERAALEEAIAEAKNQGFEKKALAEEFAEGREYSVEGLSWQGRHMILTATQKFTTGAPHFIETGHLQPAGLSPEREAEVRRVVSHALDSLGVSCGASHSELKIAPDGSIRLIEIGARMGGDFIGSGLVPLTTGVDYVAEVIRCALGEEPRCFRGTAEGAEKAEQGQAGQAPAALRTAGSAERRDPAETAERREPEAAGRAAAVRFVFGPEDLAALARLKAEHPEYLIREDVQPLTGGEVTDSSTRFGCFLLSGPDRDSLMPYLPEA